MSEVTPETQAWGRAWASVLLLVASLAALLVGGFLQFDDTSGFGSDRWDLPSGFVAVLLAVASVAVAVTDRTARRALGAALAILDVLLVGASVTDDGFRFIWGGDEGELFYLQVALGLTALSLLTPTFRSPAERTLTPWSRVTVYAVVLVGATFASFHAGTAHFESTHCGGPDFDGECDVAVLEGLAWAGATLLLLVIAFAVTELRPARRLPSQRHERGAERRRRRRQFV